MTIQMKRNILIVLISLIVIMLIVSCFIGSRPPQNTGSDTKYTITTSANNTFYGYVTGNGTYTQNSQATLTATANNGYYFKQWNDGDTTNPRIIDVTSDASYTAIFDVGACLMVNGYRVVVLDGIIEERQGYSAIKSDETKGTFCYWWTTSNSVVYSSDSILYSDELSVTSNITLHAQYNTYIGTSFCSYDTTMQTPSIERRYDFSQAIDYAEFYFDTKTYSNNITFINQTVEKGMNCYNYKVKLKFHKNVNEYDWFLSQGPIYYVGTRANVYYKHVTLPYRGAGTFLPLTVTMKPYNNELFTFQFEVEEI